MVCGALQNEEVTVNLRIRIPCSEPGGGSSKATRLVNPIAQLHLAFRPIMERLQEIYTNLW